jgi:hypothetical protein
MSAKDKPLYYPLFIHMAEEHGLTLLDAELQEIMNICKEIEQTVAKSAPVEANPNKLTQD